MILPAIAIVAAAAALVLALRWTLRRHDALGRPRPFPWISVGLLVAMAAAAFTPVLLRLRLEARLEDAASEIVGRRVQVHCQSFGEAFVDAGVELGYVRFGPDGVPERATLIKREPCADLRAYLGSDKTQPTRDQVVAVHTLTHEAVHMSGVTVEAQTECLAVQRDAEMARLLGASVEEAESLARYYWVNVYPRMPDGYRTSDCTLSTG